VSEGVRVRGGLKLTDIGAGRVFRR
jgi:hypothetical protein